MLLLLFSQLKAEGWERLRNMYSKAYATTVVVVEKYKQSIVVTLHQSRNSPPNMSSCGPLPKLLWKDFFTGAGKPLLQ